MTKTKAVVALVLIVDIVGSGVAAGAAYMAATKLSPEASICVVAGVIAYASKQTARWLLNRSE